MRSVRSGFVAALALATSPAAAAHPSQALWTVVHYLCVPDKRITRLPLPCTAVNRRQGYAIVRETSRTGYLLVPTRRLTGIEDPRLLAPGVPNYWRAAWAARRFVQRKVRRPLPPEDLGLAINAKVGRTQNQLHIHINCVVRDVRDALARSEAPPDGWTPVTLLGHAYQALRLTAEALAARDPFRLVAEEEPGGRTALGQQTMALIGRAQVPGESAGFFLVTATADAANRGHAEELLDHACEAAR